MNTATNAGANWETRWISAEGAFDPSYERTNAALRRWVDGMEQALLAATATASNRAGGTRRRASSQTPSRR
jgi:hypothetical protein